MTRPRVTAALLALAVVVAACGDSPTAPPPPPPPPVVNNTPPIVKSIGVSDTRAEVGTPVTVTAIVEDAETPIESLTYAWTAPTGTFSGTGAKVTWTAADALTPADVTLTLTVTEQYLSAGAPKQNTVVGTASVHVNNSPRELTELSLRFLGMFADSRVSPEQCVAEFTDTCRGKKEELEDIANNRHDFEILSSTLRTTGLTISDSRLSATVHTFCSFTSKVITAEPSDENCNCPIGSVGTTQGDCWTTNVYEKGRWWLCDSHYTSQSSVVTAFERAFFRLKRFELP